MHANTGLSWTFAMFTSNSVPFYSAASLNLVLQKAPHLCSGDCTVSFDLITVNYNLIPTANPTAVPTGTHFIMTLPLSDTMKSYYFTDFISYNLLVLTIAIPTAIPTATPTATPSAIPTGKIKENKRRYLLIMFSVIYNTFFNHLRSK